MLANNSPDSKVHWANVGPNGSRQDPGGPHVGPMNFAIWGSLFTYRGCQSCKTLHHELNDVNYCAWSLPITVIYVDHVTLSLIVLIVWTPLLCDSPGLSLTCAGAAHPERVGWRPQIVLECVPWPGVSIAIWDEKTSVGVWMYRNIREILTFYIRTHHDWPTQMHENLLISRVKTRAIASVLTPLINKFECICEGHAWWVCII